MESPPGVMSQSHQPIVFETGGPQWRGGGSTVSELAAPFDLSEVKIRSQNGRQLHYITARTAMNRVRRDIGPHFGLMDHG